MAKRWEKFTTEEIAQIVSESYSYREVASRLGYDPNGGSGNAAVKKMILQLNLNISHFTGQGWNKGNFNYDRFTKNSSIKGTSLAPALINLRGHKCECCKLSLWLDNPITLEVHHVDGDKTNNELDNLLLLCPNCHSQTDTWRKKKS